MLFGLATLNLTGFKGAVVQMFAHGLMTALFFALIGMVYGRTHTRHHRDGRPAQGDAVPGVFYIAGLAGLGLPGLGRLRGRGPRLPRRLRGRRRVRTA